ncbi:response regulator [Candidatus Roizmanbacteria bacterium]|nr:response regulator [Candidatus Roizmanbacteria bacterium]
MEKSRILIVEDDPFLKKLYADLLAVESYTIETAVEGEEALRKIKEGGWDLILLDIVLPKLDGFQIIQRLQSDPPSKQNKKIVFLTNLERETDVQQAKKLGIEYLIKSDLTPENFLKHIRTFLEPKQSFPS